MWAGGARVGVRETVQGVRYSNGAILAIFTVEVEMRKTVMIMVIVAQYL